ncbi:hypothetical protein [Rufibacter latericius]|uniref:Lipoprotein n=1 Tax=Rufibacter latericius TaxID=2487040 RepID=A0A3M9N0N2_9BACT|nr:hypothetical protein [Rufibacter latericius]RNI31359.1 hypothetical protein EFB08_02195 [Rufibacter latericius]
MGKLRNGLFLLLVLAGLGACERVKDKEAVADLPKTSVEDTLVLTPDTLEIDTLLNETDENYPSGTETSYQDETDSENQTGAESHNVAGAGASGTSSTRTSSASTEKGKASVTTAAGTSGNKAASVKKKYVRPTRQQLQNSLARDARRSNQMDLPQLRNYWLRRQHYYRRATKDIKYVAGDTKIKISTEETKIETPLGKVKIEGNDIKVKYD